MTWKVQFWHFWWTVIHQWIEYVDSWPKFLLFRTHHLYNSTTELTLISILRTSLYSGQKSVLRKYSITAEQQSCMQKERKSINSNIFNNCLVISFLSHLEADSYCFWSLLCSGSNISNLDALHQTHITCSDCTQFKSQFLDLRNNLSGYICNYLNRDKNMRRKIKAVEFIFCK